MERKVSMEDITYDMDGNIHFHVKLADGGTSKRVEELEAELAKANERAEFLAKQTRQQETEDYLAYEEGQAWADEAMKSREVMDKLEKYLKKKCDACQVRKEHCKLCSFYDVKEIIKPSKEEEQWELL